jgi:DNA-binding NtrC family response regulator
LPDLVDHVLGRTGDGRAWCVSADAMAAMSTYDWPGNVRELERALGRAMALAPAGVIEVEHLPPEVSGHFADVFAPPLEGPMTLRQCSAHYVRLVLQRCGSQRKAVKVLDISEHTLRAHLRRPLAFPAPAPARKARQAHEVSGELAAPRARTVPFRARRAGVSLAADRGQGFNP